MTEEGIDYKGLLDDMRTKNNQLEHEVEAWRDQWKGYQQAQSQYWTIDIKKPRFAIGDFRLFDLVGKFFSQDIEHLYKLYMVVCMVCIILTATSEIAKNLRSLDD